MGGVGALLPEWEAAEGWLETGRQIQEVLLLNQVYPDGFQKEICTQYHKTVIRSFATLQMILARRGLPSFYDIEPFRTRFLAMHRFIAEILTPDGFTPAINSAVYAQDWPAFLASGNTFFKDTVLQWHIDRGYHPQLVPVQKVEIGWGPSMIPLTYRPDMSAQKAQTCHVRFVQEIDAGAQVRFLVLMVLGECQDETVQGEVVDGRIEATVTAWGKTERIVLK